MQQKQHEEGLKKKPFPRLPRSDFAHIEEGDGHLWAVSYADLLMVLMSFFIIFFSFKDESKDNGQDGLLALAMGLRTAISGTPVVGKMVNFDETAAEAKKAPTAARYLNVDSLKSAGAIVWEEGKSLFIHFPDDIFAKRQFEIDQTTAEKLSSVYATLRPLQDKLEVIVIGHADSSNVSGGNTYLSNNFDLSSLRALRALQFLISKGFPQGHISAQGSADGLRNSRSISIRIQLKELAS